MTGTASPAVVSTQQLARAAGVTEEAIQRVARGSLAGKSWKGCHLVIIIERGRGGRSGFKYLFQLDSLPPDLRRRALELYPELALPPVAPVPAAAEAAGRELVPATRGALIRPRLPRSDRWKSRVFISREWDRAMVFLDDDDKRRIADETARDVLSLWATDQRGWRNVALLALPELMKVTRAAGFTGDDDALRAICMLPRGFIDQQRGRGLAIARYDKDAKAHFDRQPRIRRDYSALRPGELIIGDVHPMDMIYRRADGSIATPKLISWLDARSNFFIGHLVFLDKGEGVRTEHVAWSFALMVVEHGFMPTMLMTDNGGEYNWAEFAECAMRLVDEAGNPRIRINDRNDRRLIKALPYNAPAKKIEPVFRVLEQTVFRAYPGWIGGDRMAKKTHNVGRAPEPFPGSERDLWKAAQTGFDFYNVRPQEGLGGLAPVDIFAGRDLCRVDITDLQTAFAREIVKPLHRHTIRHDNAVYRHDALDARPDLESVLVRVPLFGGLDKLAVFEPNGKFICHAEPDVAYHALDQAGAVEAARRNASTRAVIREWSGDRHQVDIIGRMGAFVALNPAVAEREPAATLALNGEMKRAADDRRRIDQAGGPALPKPADQPARETPLQKLMRVSSQP